MSCGDDQEVSTRSFKIDKPLNLQDLEHGQRLAFVKYSADCSDISQVEFLSDTLIVDVHGTQIENTYVLFEYFTPYSDSYDSFTNPFTHTVNDTEDYVLIPERHSSQLFFFYANDTIFKNPTHDLNLIQDDCQLYINSNDPFIGNDIGLIEDFNIGDKRLQNKTVISCEPFFDLDGYILYDPYTIHASHVTWFGSNTVQGWMKLKDNE